MNKVARVIYEANKDKQTIKASIRLKKNGQFSSINGTVEDIKVSRDGFPYLVVHKTDQKWQSVRLENVISVVKDGKTYKR